MSVNFLRNNERTRWFNQAGGVNGCMDATAINYDATATVDDGSCIAAIPGCMDSTASNYDALANQDDGSCITGVPGCMDATATNYLATANVDDGSCILPAVPTAFVVGDIVGMNVCPTVIPPAVALCTTGRGQVEEVITDDTGSEMYKVRWVDGTQAGQSSTIGGDNLLAAQLVNGDRVSKVVGIPCDPLVLQTNPGACPIGSFPLQGTYQGMMSATVPYTYQILWDDGTTTQPLPSGFQLVNDVITTPPIPPVPVPVVPVTPTPTPVPVVVPGSCEEKEYNIAGNCVDKTIVLIALAIGAYLYVNREKNGK